MKRLMRAYHVFVELDNMGQVERLVDARGDALEPSSNVKVHLIATSQAAP
jgi:hypothetical protein